MTWNTVKLGDVLTQRKKFISIDDRLEYKRCRVQVNRKGVVLRDVVRGLEINTKKQQVCQTGDFIVAEIDAKVGGYGFITDQLAGAIVSSHYYLYEVDQDKMLPEYLAHIIQTDIIQDQISAKGSTNYSSIRSHEVLSFEIPLPPLVEQAEFIGQLNRALNSTRGIAAHLDRQLSTLADLRQSILREAVQGQLTARWREQNTSTETGPNLLKRIRAHKQQLIAAGKLKKEKPLPPITADETPFELPDGWVWCRLGDITSSIVPNRDKPKSFGGNIRWVTLPDFQENAIFLKNTEDCLGLTENEIAEYNARVIRVGNVIMSCVGRFGLVAVTSYSVVPNQQIHGFEIYPMLCAQYIAYLIKANKAYYESASQSTTIAYLNKTNCESLPCPLPPLAEQQAIVERVAGLFGKVDALVERLNTARQVAGRLRQAVLREAFTPQVEVVTSAN